MDPMTFEAMRAAFVNCSRSQLKALPPPPGLADLDWPNLDYLGWRDPKAPRRAYLVAPHGADVVGLALRAPQGSGRRKGSAMCALCASVRTTSEVDLFVAPRAGSAGRAHNTVGTYICTDLACSLYVRGLRELDLPQGERLPVPARVARLTERLAAFVARAVQN
ncbi:FBP domain-containing protein [Angustibacter luteus]|uniref:FBP domain-containing protein n=1 Tax=Angustibacter luteus TaxID=658456 RepID=A0ABW1JEA5_9ACTN